MAETLSIKPTIPDSRSILIKFDLLPFNLLNAQFMFDLLLNELDFIFDLMLNESSR